MENSKFTDRSYENNPTLIILEDEKGQFLSINLAQNGCPLYYKSALPEGGNPLHLGEFFPNIPITESQSKVDAGFALIELATGVGLRGIQEYLK